MLSTIRAWRIAPAVMLAAGALVASTPAQVLAWGHTGHVGVSQIAILNLPAEIPAFLRTTQAVGQIAELGAEADESKTTGIFTGLSSQGRIQTAFTAHDAERDPGHYVDIDESNLVLGGAVSLGALPATREAFDTAQRAAASPAGQTQYTAGYLPYTMIDGFQQVRKDFGIWRAMSAGLQSATSDTERAYFRYQLQLRQQLIIRDIGYWSHFVADASQPMHVSIHFNGWGNYPNPQNYTKAGIHAPFEGSFVRNFIDFNQVAALVRPYTDRGVATNEQRVPLYLAETLGQLEPAYAAARNSGNDNYQTAQPLEIAVVQKQLAAGASELRDQIVDAWRQSAFITIGFPLVKVSDAEAGIVRITPATFGAD